MKAYVRSYRNNLDTERFEVNFGGADDALKFDEWGARRHRDLLESNRVSSNGHQCEFVVDKLKSGEFAVACVDHPNHVKPDPSALFIV
jgi:hypothetical protein